MRHMQRKMANYRVRAQLFMGEVMTDDRGDHRLKHHALVRLVKAFREQKDLEASIQHAESILRGDWKTSAAPTPALSSKDGTGGAA